MCDPTEFIGAMGDGCKIIMFWRLPLQSVAYADVYCRNKQTEFTGASERQCNKFNVKINVVVIIE